MNVTQIYALVNDATEEALGQSSLLTEDLSNIVAVGEAVANANAYDNYVKALVNRIGKTIFVTRKYKGTIPNVIFEGWEYGSILQKISGDLPEATENESWSLTDGSSYDPNVFHQPSVSVKFFNKRWTFEVELSVTNEQVKESFTSKEQLNNFIEMLFNDVDKSLEVKIDSLVMRTINGAIVETIHDDYGNNSLSASTHVKARNLLYEYNQANGTTLTATTALITPDFLRYASAEMGMTADRLKKMSTLFNVGGKARFTPREDLRIILHSDFANKAKAYLYGDTFHAEYVKLPEADTIPYWQGSGTSYSYADTAKVDAYLPTDGSTQVTVSNILGVMFDKEALGVVNYKRYTTSNYNPKGEFTNFWHKLFAGQFIDLNENFVVFFMA